MVLYRILYNTSTGTRYHTRASLSQLMLCCAGATFGSKLLFSAKGAGRQRKAGFAIRIIFAALHIGILCSGRTLYAGQCWRIDTDMSSCTLRTTLKYPTNVTFTGLTTLLKTDCAFAAADRKNAHKLTTLENIIYNAARGPSDICTIFACYSQCLSQALWGLGGV